MTLKKNTTTEERTSQGEIIAGIRNSLAVILENTELLLQQEEWFSKEGKKHLKQIKTKVWGIDKLLQELKK